MASALQCGSDSFLLCRSFSVICSLLCLISDIVFSTVYSSISWSPDACACISRNRRGTGASKVVKNSEHRNGWWEGQRGVAHADQYFDWPELEQFPITTLRAKKSAAGGQGFEEAEENVENRLPFEYLDVLCLWCNLPIFKSYTIEQGLAKQGATLDMYSGYIGCIHNHAVRNTGLITMNQFRLKTWPPSRRNSLLSLDRNRAFQCIQWQILITKRLVATCNLVPPSCQVNRKMLRRRDNRNQILHRHNFSGGVRINVRSLNRYPNTVICCVPDWWTLNNKRQFLLKHL